MKRDMYQLQKENKAHKAEVETIKQHVEHYKSKAQQWKNSSLIQDQNNKKLKADLLQIQKRLNDTDHHLSTSTADKFSKLNCDPASTALARPFVPCSKTGAAAASSTVLKDVNLVRRSRPNEPEDAVTQLHNEQNVSSSKVSTYIFCE